MPNISPKCEKHQKSVDIFGILRYNIEANILCKFRKEKLIMRNTKRFFGLFMAAMMILSCISGMIFVSAEGETTEIKPVFIYEGWLLDCNGDNNCEKAAYDYNKGYVTLTATGEDPYYYLTAGMVAAPYMVIKYRTTASEGMKGEMYIGNSAGPDPATSLINWGLTCGNEWKCDILNIGDMGDYNVATNVLNHVRFDFFANYEEGATLDVEYIAFFNTEADAQAYIDGNMHKLPGEPREFTATFVKQDGSVVRTITYKEGTPSINEPAVPKVKGMVGKWEKYTLNGNITIKPVYTEYNPHLFDNFNHVDQFGEEHAEYFQFEQCVSVFNEDRTITFKGSWGIDAEVWPKISIDYYRLMQNFNGTGAKFNKKNLANGDGDGNVIVFKIKGCPVMAEKNGIQLTVTAGLGGNKQEYYVYPINTLKGDGSEEYIFFDLTGEDGYENLFINSMILNWAYTIGDEENRGSEFTLISIDMFATMEDALGATGETMPETEAPTEKPTEPEETTTEPEDSSAADSETEAPKAEKKGCGSVVATGAAVAVLAAAAAAVALKKKD